MLINQVYLVDKISVRVLIICLSECVNMAFFPPAMNPNFERKRWEQSK